MITPSPYPGLRPFQQDEAYLFFGREAQVEDMLARLEERRFLAVVGTSGCGKSSLVRAGLLPALEQGFLSDAKPNWRMAVMNPGSAPFDNLTTALLSETALGRERQTSSQAASLLQATLRRGPLGLVEAVAESPLAKDTNLFLVVDQFEEIFRYRKQTKNVNDADAFVSLLLASAQSRESDVPIYVVITMRSDFIGDCALFTGLPETINDSQFLTPRLTRDQYRAAIAEPALIAGGQLTDALVNRLLNDLRGEPDQLPVLQHVLMRMWTQDAEDVPEKALTLDDYKAVGGLAGALSKHCDEILRDLNAQQQQIAEVMFRALCERSSEQRDTRRPVRLGEVANIVGVDIEVVIPVVDAFRGAGRNFLTPPLSIALNAETTLDISHESLIRQWQTLNTWVASEVESARQYQRLEDFAKRRQQREGAELWRGVDLGNARVWKERQKPTEAWAARYGDAYQLAMDFLQESEYEEEKQQRENEHAHQREVERVRELAEVQRARAQEQRARAQEQRARAQEQAALDAEQTVRAKEQAVRDAEQAKTARRLKVIAAATLALLLVTLSVAIYAFIQRNRAAYAYQRAAEAKKLAEEKMQAAERAANDRLARYFSTVSQTSIEIQPTLSILLSIEATNALLIPEAEEALRNTITKITGTALVGYADGVWGVAFSPDGQVLATGSDDKTVRLWALNNPTAEPRVLRGHEDGVWGVVFSPDGQVLATGSADKTVRLWALNNPTAEPRVLRGHEGGVWGVAFSPDGQVLATGSADKTVRLWALNNPTAEPRVLRGHEGGVWGVAFSPDGQVLATGSDDKTVRLWALNNPTAEPRVLRGHEDGVWGVAFSPDGQVLATGSADKTVRLWWIRIDVLVRIACLLSGRNFSYEDWQRFLSHEPYRKTCQNRPLHPSFLAIIWREIKNGDLQGALTRLLTALRINGTSDIVLQEEARRLAAPGLLEKGQELAQKGDIESAIGEFKKALELDPNLDLDPAKEARRLAASGLLEKGQELAQKGDIESAIGEFKKALELDPNLDLDPAKEARRLAALALVQNARWLAKQGAIQEAIAAYAAAQASDLTPEIDAISWNSLCWYGSLGGFATDVMAACERAVALEPADGNIIDSRGLARTLTGDYPGAIDDFQRYLEWGPNNGAPEERIRRRQDWIRALLVNQNPFNQELLKLLWNE